MRLLSFALNPEHVFVRGLLVHSAGERPTPIIGAWAFYSYVVPLPIAYQYLIKDCEALNVDPACRFWAKW